MAFISRSPKFKLSLKIQEIFGGLSVGQHDNDGRALFDRILKVGPANIVAALEGIEGPYALVYYEVETQRLYFARDPLGRRSLLLHSPTVATPRLMLTSSAPSATAQWDEVSCEAVHVFDFSLLSNLQASVSSYFVSGVHVA